MRLGEHTSVVGAVRIGPPLLGDFSDSRRRHSVSLENDEDGEGDGAW